MALVKSLPRPAPLDGRVLPRVVRAGVEKKPAKLGSARQTRTSAAVRDGNVLTPRE